MTDFNTVIGGPMLCAWQPCAGVVWVQTRSSEHAMRLAKREDGHRVAFSVTAGYLRIYEFRHSLGWARKLIARYTLSETASNERKRQLAAPLRARANRT